MNPIEKTALALKATCESLESDHSTLLGYREAGTLALAFKKDIGEVIDGKIAEIHGNKEKHHEICALKAKELPGAHSREVCPQRALFARTDGTRMHRRQAKS